ncbi:hypothetical protein ACFYWX_11880 [Streptomyces sp. NPDC002888]|uniref:hypothetical protein n=1 Tax=Streptomyces sp. NPDC002888 TaxID=3364668 RepID=UPI0036813045
MREPDTAERATTTLSGADSSTQSQVVVLGQRCVGVLVEPEDFWLEYVDGRGELHSGPFEAMWSTRFEAAGQVRAFPSYRGQRNFPGWYWAATSGELVGFESWVELGHLMRMFGQLTAELRTRERIQTA